ncbi:hypothetical protein [Tenacibaculum xiamenense]|uniref:hypothetical protein n=1 Tax=Tenacibaculum xiamenense TaxID=1261553 RepID=UPI0038960361
MNLELIIDKLLRNVTLIRRLDLEDVVYLEVSDYYDSRDIENNNPIWTNHCYVYQVFKKDSSYKRLSFLDFMAFHLTRENFPSFFEKEEVILEDVIKRIKENKGIESYDVFDLREIYFSEESVHVSYFNNTYDSFIIVTEREIVADRFFKTFEYIGVSCKKMLDPRFLEVMVDLEFKLKHQNDLLMFEKTIIGLDSFLDKIKEENYVKFELVNTLVHLNFKEEILEKKQVLSDSMPYIIESNNSKVIDFLVNILETVSVKYNRMLYNKNLEINPHLGI